LEGPARLDRLAGMDDRRQLGRSLLAACALAVLARRPHTLMTRSFWLDEAWVADSVRAPLRQVGLLASSSPLGWTLLLRLVPPFGGPERYRVLTLLAGAAAVVPAVLLGRRLGRLHGALAGLAVALLPAALARPWLKQYPFEVLAALVLVALTARVSAAWSGRRLAALGAVAAGAILVSNSVPFVTAAAFAALAAEAALTRRWRRLAALALVAAPVAAGQLAWYRLVAAGGDNPAMRAYWAGAMVPLDAGPGAAVAVVARRAGAAFGQLGFGPAPLALALAGAGAVATWRAGARAAALLPLLVVAPLLAAGAGRYPFMDERTSLFALALVAVQAALGVAALARAAWRWAAPAGVAVLVLAAALVLPAAVRAAASPMPGLDVAAQVERVRAGRRPGDTVAVSFGASFAFAYYWPERPAFAPATAPTAVRFRVDYPGRPDLVLATGGDRAAIAAALARAAARRGPGGRVWLVVGDAGAELPAWRAAAAGLGPVDAGPGGAPLLLAPAAAVDHWVTVAP
jgi:hypothetical protein